LPDKDSATDQTMKYSFLFCFLKSRGPGRGERGHNIHARHFGGFILCTHCHKFKLLFSEYKCLDHSGIYTRKNGGSTQYSQALSYRACKRHKDTRVMHTLKCLVFMFYVTLDYFLPGRSDPKKLKDNRAGQICQTLVIFLRVKVSS